MFGDGGYLLNLGTYTGAPGSKSRKVTHVRSVFFLLIFCHFISNVLAVLRAEVIPPLYNLTIKSIYMAHY